LRVGRRALRIAKRDDVVALLDGRLRIERHRLETVRGRDLEHRQVLTRRVAHYRRTAQLAVDTDLEALPAVDHVAIRHHQTLRGVEYPAAAGLVLVGLDEDGRRADRIDDRGNVRAAAPAAEH